MKTTQARIAAIFSVFLLALCLSKIVLCIIRVEPICDVFIYPRTIYWIMLLVFLLTLIKENGVLKLLQVAVIFAGSIWNFSNAGSSDFFGIAGLTVSSFLAFQYGFFDSLKPIKITLVNVVLFVCFSTFASLNAENKIVHGLEVLLFLDVFIFIIWAIFKDSISKMQESEDCQRERFMKIIDEATSVARDTIALCEKEKEKIEKE